MSHTGSQSPERDEEEWLGFTQEELRHANAMRKAFQKDHDTAALARAVTLANKKLMPEFNDSFIPRGTPLTDIFDTKIPLEDNRWQGPHVATPAPKPIEKEQGISTDSQARKDAPVFSGFCAYFPNAMFEVARLSKAGNDKHNPGERLHWSKGKSNDHGDCILRHQLEAFDIDPDDGFYHAVKVAWRAMAQLETLLTDRD